MPRLVRVLTVAIFITLFAVRPAPAVIVLGPGSDVTDPGRNLNAPPSNLGAYVGTFGSFLGTPIAPQYFVTAYHINDGSSPGTFLYANNTNTVTPYTVSFVARDQDLAIWKVADTGPLFTYYAPLYLAGNEVNQSLVTIGRGTARGGAVPASPAQPQGWAWGASDSKISWGTNRVDAIINSSQFPSPIPGFGGDFLYFTFDQTKPDHNNVGIYSGGDSGGPTFVRDPADGVYKLAGINSLVDQVNDGHGNNAFALFDAFGFFDGSNQITTHDPLASYATRIDDHLPFLSDFAPIPEPTSLVLTFLGAAGLACHGWRRRRTSRLVPPA
ncbi:hypothetical protein AYO44_12195 [Planctomycetaceae bacterium SCGC AG-212-F19]|nr:hypothetical protein AYO44_12195 [Planctomycetaceae bacterium SCGC AG-212-F19]